MALFKHLSFIRANKGIVGWVYSMKCLLRFHEDLDGSSIAEQIEHWTCNSEALTASWNIILNKSRVQIPAWLAKLPAGLPQASWNS